MAKTTATKKTAVAKVQPAAQDTVVEHTAPPTARKTIVIPEVKLSDIVEVKSCVVGGLIYVASNGAQVAWDDLGSSQYMTVQDLLTMRNTQKAFFVNNWICLCGENADDVTAFLQLDRYMQKVIDPDHLDDLFSMTPKDLRDVLSGYTESMLTTVARRAYELIQDGALDSNKVIEAIESATGYDLRA